MYFGELMPVIFRCSACGSVIYVFKRVGQDCFGLPSPTELINRLGGVCPNCGNTLSVPKISDIKILGRVVESIDSYLERSLVNDVGSQGGILRITSEIQE